MSTEQVSPAAPFDVWWDDDAGIIRFRVATGAVFGVVEAAASTEAVRALGRGAVPLLVDMRGIARLDRGAREHFKIERAGTTASAMLVESAMTKVIANFFMAIDGGQTPQRMFSDEAAAVAWLGQQRGGQRAST